jgi:hypothetical protein
VIEGVFAEAKEWHGLRRAWRRGISKMKVQCLLIAAVINLKRLRAVFMPFTSPNPSITGLFRSILRGLIRQIRIFTSRPIKA